MRMDMTYIDYFKEICSMPHGSGNTKIISDWLVKFAVDHGLEYHQDAANNVIIRIHFFIICLFLISNF
ncbi:MAG: hypothetical protein J6X08_01870 [Lachnospiraceae bacterium]|nr:hypothetical protein [Lachnospiraceae bacterium]